MNVTGFFDRTLSAISQLLMYSNVEGIPAEHPIRAALYQRAIEQVLEYFNAQLLFARLFGGPFSSALIAAHFAMSVA
jgi:hypothetical protein